MQSPQVILIGAGIGGLATAIALRQAGFSPVLYERAPEIRALGAGLLLWPNAIKALNHLGLTAR
jgi:2-polyprenyl-6-methoxyphenol hydroxylase-like FAD-dependent oxidoreductase